MKKKYIVFSDLDGTLLDHNTYSLYKSLEGINILKSKKIPLILVSSKTYPEIKKYHEEIIINKLECSYPYSFENGGGIAYPEKDNENPDIYIEGFDVKKEINEKLDILVKTLGSTFKMICEEKYINNKFIKKRMTIDEIIKETGMDKDHALLSTKRMCSIPFLMNKEINLNTINETLKNYKLTLIKGGRFYHLTAQKADKGNAVKKIIEHLIKNNPLYYPHDREIFSIGIGDSENDISMLKAVDKLFLVKKHDGSTIDDNLIGTITNLNNSDWENKIERTSGEGPAGFTEAIKKIFL